jgi:hypothetical protein
MGNSSGRDSSSSSVPTRAELRMNPVEPNPAEAPRPSLNPKVEGSNPSRPIAKGLQMAGFVGRENGWKPSRVNIGC